jgi:HAD superfamily hydrolase (TIGR01509 family)
MDGLLVDSERLAREALIRTAGMFEIEPDAETFSAMIGLPEDGSLRLLRLRYGLDFPAEQYVRDTAAACETLVSTGHLALKPGAEELLSLLNRLGIPKALATSSSREKAMRTLAAVRATECFEAIVTRTDVARGKPSPDLFAKAALELDLPPDQCIALEDSYNGVRAAHAAGIRVIMVPDLLPATPEMAALSGAVVDSLYDVHQAFLIVGSPPAQSSG